MPTALKSKQFKEPWYSAYYFLKQDIDIQCPECGGHAVSSGTSEYLLPWYPTNTRVVCTKCRYTKKSSSFSWSGPVKGFGRRPCGACGHKWVNARVCCDAPPAKPFNTVEARCPVCDKPNVVDISWSIDFFSGRPLDPYNGERLWYVDSVKGNEIWAYNTAHLTYLREYISSSLRERGEHAGKYSIITNLPGWMKTKKNRDDVLKALDRLMKK
ncbi:hypothetical protein [Desulfoluna spongiiphila]|uniref:Uncharacterized protein n=1 Tax=Desulfoluna spongiiphila TaxID=419481 RepID=A0A1G5DWK2_9BACT|nr:hypothetical protein [Desulfoluna spongiiphila]SCY18977.1 hypothetical protein SAMN05216233_10532 [Desulfoluna spongiiphila]VVS91455.1 hypothetical protein DBB_10230 [Desulfoluna spongiiphila]